jgi:hypothetical protein
MADTFGSFEVGRRYENRRGPYEVLGITPPTLQIRYDSGEVINADLATQARIIENMSHPAASAYPKVRKADPSREVGQLQRPRAPSSVVARPVRARSGSRRANSDRTAVEFSPGNVYRRRNLHAMYRGQEQGGICTPKDFAIILLFTGQNGDLYGYKDHWDDDGIFRYFGEGQFGDMEFSRGNRAIRDHLGNGEELHLFETIGDGDVRYVGVMACIGYDFVSDVPDASGKRRTAIVFKLAPG